MKRVYFVRHAKSSWDDSSLRDHDRSLNTRGKRQSKKMGEFLCDQLISVDAVLCSSAKRAKSTMKQLKKSLEFKEIIILESLYLAMEDEIMHELSSLEKSVESAMVVGHNPTMTALANAFSHEFVSNVPTSGIFKVDFFISEWEEISLYNGSLEALWTPKLLDIR